VRRNGDVAQDDAVTAGSGKPPDVPVVLDGGFGCRNEQHHFVERPVRFGSHRRAEDQPLRVVTARAERPESAHDVIFPGAPRSAARGEHCGDARIRIGAVDVALRGLREQPHKPGVRVHYAEAPSGCAAPARDDLDHVEMPVQARLVASPSRGLQDPEEAGVAQERDDLGKHSARADGLEGACRQARRELRRARDAVHCLQRGSPSVSRILGRNGNGDKHPLGALLRHATAAT